MFIVWGMLEGKVLVCSFSIWYNTYLNLLPLQLSMATDSTSLLQPMGKKSSLYILNWFPSIFSEWSVVLILEGFGGKLVHVAFPLLCDFVIFTCMPPQHFEFSLQSSWSLLSSFKLPFCASSLSLPFPSWCVESGAANCAWDESSARFCTEAERCPLFCSTALLGSEDKLHHQLLSAAMCKPLSQPFSFGISLILRPCLCGSPQKWNKRKTPGIPWLWHRNECSFWKIANGIYSCQPEVTTLSQEELGDHNDCPWIMLAQSQGCKESLLEWLLPGGCSYCWVGREFLISGNEYLTIHQIYNLFWFPYFSFFHV